MNILKTSIESEHGKIMNYLNIIRFELWEAKVYLFSPGIEPGTFCVLDRCDNRYTTKTCYVKEEFYYTFEFS